GAGVRPPEAAPDPNGAGVLLRGLLVVPVPLQPGFGPKGLGGRVGKPPGALAIPPNFGAWQQALLPSERALRNGRVVAELPQSIWNSAVVSLGTTLLTLPLGGLAGYGLARFAHLRFMRGLLFLFMLTRMLPGLALMIPFF